MIICFEGINGAGKSTQINLLKTMLNEAGVKCHVLHDPGVRDGHPAQELRPMFVYGDRWADPRTPLLVGSAARNELTVEIRKIQHEHPEDCIILDRYEMSTYVYQTLMLEDGGFEQSEALEMIRSLHHILRCATPDLLIILDTMSEVAYPRRLKGRRATDKPVDDQFEVRGLAFSKRLAERYLHMAQYAESDQLCQKLIVASATKTTTEQEVFNMYRESVEALLAGRTVSSAA